MHEFYIGQKVVCVDARPGSCPCPEITLKRGEVYQIDTLAVKRDYTLKRDNQIVCFLSGCANHWYGIWRFRPLEEKPDAIEWARQICRDVSAGNIRDNRQKIVAGLREAIEYAKRGQ